MNKLILIDGNAIFHRAYHSIPPFRTQSGEVTNAIYGFMRMFIDIFMKESPDYIVVAWDMAEPTFRHKEFKEYKANRPPPPDDLFVQLPRLKALIDVFGVTMLEHAGDEADDIIGTVSKMAEGIDDLRTIIITGDKDAFQLVNDKTFVMTPVKGISIVEVYDEYKVKEKMGIRPDQVVDFKALSGDPSDNIPGVPGIGKKGAVDLLDAYDNLDGVYAHLDEIPAGKKKKLVEGKDSAYLSQRLATIIKDCDVDTELEHFKVKALDYNEILRQFEALEFKSLEKKVLALKNKMPVIADSQQSLF